MKEKLLSGRYFFTIVSAGVFAWASVNKIISSEQIVSIVMLVVAFYFNRNDRQKKEEGQ